MIKLEDSTYYDISVECQAVVWEVLRVLDGAPLFDSIKILDCTKRILEYNSVWHYPKPEPEKNEIAELADKVAGQVAEAIKQLHADKPLP